jgi:hypothetical protein
MRVSGSHDHSIDQQVHTVIVLAECTKDSTENHQETPDDDWDLPAPTIGHDGTISARVREKSFGYE